MESYEERMRRRTAEANAKVEAATKAFWPKLRDALESRGHKVTVDDKLMFGQPNMNQVITKIDGYRVGFTLKPHFEHQQMTGKLVFSMGEPRARLNFHQSATRGNDFDYKRIVDTIEARIRDHKAEVAQRDKENQALFEAQQVRDRLAREFFKEPMLVQEFEAANPATPDEEMVTLADFPAKVPVRLQTDPKGITLVFRKTLDEGQLRELLTTCKKIGLLDA